MPTPEPKARPSGVKQRTRHTPPIPAIWQIVVECRSEGEQEALYERLRKEGYPCRVLTL